MNDLVLKQNTVGVITLKEITDILEVRHDKAKIKVDELIKEPDFGEVSKMDTFNLNNVKVETYLLTKKQAIIVGAKLNNSLLIKLVDKIEEIETKNKPVELSRKDLALMVIRAEEEKEVFAIENQNLKSTIIEKDNVIIAVADLNIKAGEVSIGDFSKNIAIENLGRNNLFAWLKARNFLMMNTEPYQQYVTRGYFVRKPSNKRVNGEVKYTTMLTPKGTIWLTKMLNAEFDLNIEVK